MGKKNWNALSPNTEGVRRGAVGAEDRARSFTAARGSGERCELPQRVRAEDAKRHLVNFSSESALSGKALKGY